MVFPWEDRNWLLRLFSARCFSLTGLAVGGSSVAALGISPDTFPERVHRLITLLVFFSGSGASMACPLALR